jgi:hypothetical protein
MPVGERQWTCRVYVKEALNALHNDRILSLPASIGKLQEQFPSMITLTHKSRHLGSIERACLKAANSYLPYRAGYQQAWVYNDLTWTEGSTSRTTPMEVDSGPYYLSQMEVDSTRGGHRLSRTYGSRMDVDSTGGHRSSRSYGSRMDVDSSAGRRVYRTR